MEKLNKWNNLAIKYTMYDTLAQLYEVKAFYEIEKKEREDLIKRGVIAKPSLSEKEVRTIIANIKKDYFEIFGEKIDLKLSVLKVYLKEFKEN